MPNLSGNEKSPGYTAWQSTSDNSEAVSRGGPSMSHGPPIQQTYHSYATAQRLQLSLSFMFSLSCFHSKTESPSIDVTW